MGSVVTKQVIYVAAHIRQVTLNREDEAHVQELSKRFECTKISSRSSINVMLHQTTNL